MTDKFVAQIVIEYDTAEGRFNLKSNTSDEVLVAGMLATAADKFKENNQLERIKELQAKQSNGIITVQ